jgi:hypothetical protein
VNVDPSILRRWLDPRRCPITALVIVGFLCGLAWARARDPFVCAPFSARFGAGEKVQAVAVLGKPSSRRPVVIYLQDAGTGLEEIGPNLRQLAELDMAAVAMKYDQTNQTVFNRQLSALLAQVGSEPWAQTNAVAWLAHGLGAQRLLRFARWHDQPQPQLLLCLAGGQVADLIGLAKATQLEHQRSAGGDTRSLQEERPWSGPLAHCPVALVTAKNDEVYPVQNSEQLAALLRCEGVHVETCSLSGLDHAFGENQRVVFRLVAEYIAHKLGVTHTRRLEQPMASRGGTWLYWAPFFALTVILIWGAGRKVWQGAINNPPQSWLAKGFTALAACVGLAAAADAALHLILPRCASSQATNSLARYCLLTPEWREGFDLLTTDSGWKRRPLKQLLEHVELASLQRSQFYTNLNAQMYRDFILSPRISPSESEQWGWRRTLWEAFSPRVRKSADSIAAARTIVYFLRERVTISDESAAPEGVETCWSEGWGSEAGFEQLYVATLRSVGVAARLSKKGQAELWTGSTWEAAPQLFATRGLPFVEQESPGAF